MIIWAKGSVRLTLCLFDDDDGDVDDNLQVQTICTHLIKITQLMMRIKVIYVSE